MVYVAWGALGGTFRVSARPQKLEDLRTELFIVGVPVIFHFFPRLSDAAW